MALGIPLEQLIPLLPDPSGFLVIHPQPHQQGLECLLGLISITKGLGHLQLKIGHLLGKGSQLGHPLLGDNKLSYHLPS